MCLEKSSDIILYLKICSQLPGTVSLVTPNCLNIVSQIIVRHYLLLMKHSMRSYDSKLDGIPSLMAICRLKGVTDYDAMAMVICLVNAKGVWEGCFFEIDVS